MAFIGLFIMLATNTPLHFKSIAFEANFGNENDLTTFSGMVNLESQTLTCEGQRHFR